MNVKTWSLIVTSFLSVSLLAGAAQAELFSCHSLFLTDVKKPNLEDSVFAANLVLRQLITESKQFPEANFFLKKLQSELDLYKEHTSKYDQGEHYNRQAFYLEAAAELRKEAPYLHDISPKLFDKNFKIRQPESWSKLEKTDLVIRHFDQVLDLWTALPGESIPKFLYQEAFDFMAIARDRVQNIVGRQMVGIGAKQWAAIEEKVIDRIQTYKNDRVVLEQLLTHLSSSGFATERIIFEVMEIRKEFEKTLPPPQFRRQTGADANYFLTLTTAEYAFLEHLPLKSATFQNYLLTNRASFAYLHPVFLPTASRLIDPVNVALKDAMEKGPSTWGSLRIAAYFLKYKIYEEDTAQFLLQMTSKWDKLTEAQQDYLNRLLHL